MLESRSDRDIDPHLAEGREAQRQMVRAAVERWRKEQRARDKREMNESMPNTQPPTGERFLLGPKITVGLGRAARGPRARKRPGSDETRQVEGRVMLVTATILGRAARGLRAEAPRLQRDAARTGSQPGVCDNDVGDLLLLKSLKNKLDYCSPRDIQIYYSTAILDRSMDSIWVKLPLLRKLMLSHAEVEWFWWMDSDAVFTDMTFDVPFEKYEPHVHMVVHGYDSLVYGKKDWVGLNAGIYLIRNSQWSLDFMEDLAQFGVKGPMRDAAGVKLFKELSTRPMFEGDDQSAIVWMIAYHPEKYAKGIYLESSFMLHSFWPTITPHYEELMDKYHPGYGDHRWPLITHFVGCRPCGKIGQIEYEETQRCVENMER
ncbi:unnamed protein product [Closterium sp. Naga37s-1]|nr:unnamed protein product [Closterium sp. Naga37s-1]